MNLDSTWLAGFSSFAVVAMLAVIHITIGRWHWLDRSDHSPWLSLSAGAALAYVFVYLLPKLAATQTKLNDIMASNDWQPYLRNQVYLIAMLGLVFFFWLGWLDERFGDSRATGVTSRKGRLLLNIAGYGVYSMQVGFLVAGFPRPDLLSFLLAGVVLGLHLMGVDHGVRERAPQSYDSLLRWVFSIALFIGWGIGTSTATFDTLIMLWSAFIGGGIVITALREELPSGRMTSFVPFLGGVGGTTAAILIIQGLQN
jgi:hypothetical protein